LGFVFVVQIPAVQKKMAKEFTSWLSEEYQIQIQSDKIKLGILSGLQWNDVLLLDSQQDTLVYVEEVKIQASNLSFNHFKKVYLKGLQLNYQYGDSIADAELFRYIEPFLNSKKESKALVIDNFWINGARIDVGSKIEQRSFRNLDLYLRDCQLSSETSFVLSNMEWVQFQGQKHQLEAKQIKISNQENTIDGLSWESGSSLMKLDFRQSKDSAELIIHQLDIDENAIAGLYTQWPNSLQLGLSAKFKVVGDSLWSENLQINSDKGSIVNGTLAIKSWNDFKNWNYNIQANQFDLVADEWLWIESLFEHSYLLSRFGAIRSQATLKGTMSDLNLNLVLNSDQGNIESDLFIDISDSLDVPIYKGDLTLNNFNLAAFVGDTKFGTLNAEVSVDGEGFDLTNFDTDVHGTVKSIAINDYEYKNITLDGRLQPNHFKGEAFVVDENLEVDFSGEIDFSKEKPVMDFVADIIEANLVKLNWYDKSPVAKLSTLVEMNFIGDKWANIEGDIGVYFTTVETFDNYYHFNDIHFSSEKLSSKDVLTLTSDFANANFEGTIDVPNLFNSFFAYLSPHFPLLNKGRNKAQNFVFEVDLFNTSALTNLFIPQLNLGDGASITGSFNNRGEGLSLAVESPNLGWGKWLWRDLKINSKATSQHWEIGLTGAKLDFNNRTKIENIEIDQVGNYGDWRYAMAWISNDSIKFDGIVKGAASVDTKSLNIGIEESQFYFADTLWTVNESSKIKYSKNKVSTSISLKTVSQNIAFLFDGNIRDNTIDVEVSDFEFDNLSPWLSRIKSSIDGTVNGRLNRVQKNNIHQLNSSIQTSQLIVNDYLFGALNIDVLSDSKNEIQNIDGFVSKNELKTVEFNGAYMSSLDSNNFNVSMDVYDFDMRHLRSYLDVVVTDVEGKGAGYLNFYGNLSKPEFDGELIVEDVSLAIPFLNINFNAIDNSVIQLSDRHIEFKDFDFVSTQNEEDIGEGALSGDVFHYNFKDFALDLSIVADSLLCLNTDAYRDEAYYGRAIATGDASFSGPLQAIAIEVNAVTDKGSSLFIPLDEDESLDELSFVHFIEKNENVNDTVWTLSDQVKKSTGLTIDMNFELNENAQTNIIFDETLGDKISARGTGFINVGLNSADEVYMFGDYTLSEGDYLFTLQNFVNKKFEIQKGAQLLWDGNPYTAQMDLNALYHINTNISALSPEYNRNSDVECMMSMTGDLLQPNIEFDIQIPKGDDYIKRLLDERTNTEEKKTQQFLSLLVLNSFMSTDELENTDVDYLSSTLSTGTEMLNNQLSNWLSQTTDRFDLGLKYHPNLGDTLSNKEFELLLNNMKVNDRITFNGNIGTQPAQNTTRVIGDFKVEYRLSDDGKLRLLAFRNLEESFQLQDASSNYTTGLGLFYRYEFDNFSDMWQKFLRMFRKKEYADAIQ
jgi:hypothetical protein